MSVDRYNLRFPDGATAADIELLCFARSHSPEMGGLGRFEHLRNAIDLLWNEPRRRAAAERKLPYDRDKDDAFIWNDWTELMMRGYCDNREVIVAGPGACVAGHTRLWNPITGESPTIQELHQNNVAPVVMTLHGPEQAGVPFTKGVDELFEVTCSDGSRFTATGKHRLLTPAGYARVDSLSIDSPLFGYEHAPRESSEGDDLLARVRDVRGSRKRAEESQCDNRSACRK